MMYALAILAAERQRALLQPGRSAAVNMANVKRWHESESDGFRKCINGIVPIKMYLRKKY